MPLSILGPDGKRYENKIASSLQKVTSWKTKDVFPYQVGMYALRHNGILTAYDDPDFTWTCEEKWITSAYTSSVIFKILEKHGIPTTHYDTLNANTTLDFALNMLPFEIIWRRYNVEGNSWEKRNPNNKYALWEKYDEIIYEVGLKWSVINEDGEVCHDPFIVLDQDFQPQLNTQWLPRLVHQRTGKELNYKSVLLKDTEEWDNWFDVLRKAIELFTERKWEIQEMTQKIQEIVFMTYAEIGRLNADGKIEFGIDTNKELRLGDELELDTVRNMNPETIEIDGETYEFKTDILWTNIEQVLGRAPEAITRIITWSG